MSLLQVATVPKAPNG